MLRARTPRRPPTAVRRALTFWRRSIQARVVVSTVLLSAVVVSGVGWLLLQQTRDGLLENRVDKALAEVADEVDEANDRLVEMPATDPDPTAQRYDLVDLIVQRGATRGYQVVMAGPVGSETGLIASGPTEASPHLDLASVPPRLEEHFSVLRNGSAWTYTRIGTIDDEGTVIDSEPGVVVGVQVPLPADGKTYTLYFLFPLDEEQQTMGLVTRAMLTAGGLLVVLIAVLTWLVARQVVTPIRLARRVAERLAAGRLTERLRVTGEDDLARLATSFNQMATNLQRQIRQLEELSRVQRRFVSDVSHELRTPLTTVRMAGDVLHDARGDFDPATARAAELLQTELDRFETLLADLLEISRFDAGAAVLELDDVNLVDVAHRVVEATRPLAEQRDVRIVIRAPDHPCLAQADVRRVERIVRNLVTNAIDHARPLPADLDYRPDVAQTPEIVVTVAADEQAAAIAVRDYGVGLAPGESSMVFNRFWRADPARARTSGGTGLGLSISQEDAHLHGGWLQAWGRLGEGSQFRLTLPRRAGDVLRQSPLPLVPADAPEPVS
ncbi:MtrAB system histidine kinase MtrB [Nocardioides sp.]|uniref:MtrAB system histidine kinase MtrB n=1 Tax=Nocardioides sp. TaxID=35761 RepID=UPI001A285F80|nr:MtrAB system histidine kinase MtrB [Nocardioides sp.]MBJ7359484.1 HAMP domain-containing histidine kinase [Nocardioides sp.]